MAKQISNDFKTHLLNVLKVEGGYSDADGYPTNFGVRQDMYNAWAKENDLPAKDVKELNFGEVRNFYEDSYFKKPGLDKISDFGIQGVVFDSAVNHGQQTAVKMLQRVVGAEDDGLMGPKTAKAVDKDIKENGSEALADGIFSERMNVYQKGDPKFWEGWNNRLIQVRSAYYQQPAS